MAKKQDTAVERVYNVPLRKEYMKVARWKRTKKAVIALREFLSRHMKSEDVRLSKELNEQLWENGIRNPPHHVKVSVKRDDKGVVRAELFGEKKEAKSTAKKPAKKEAIKKEEESPAEEKQ
ncbi:MAG: 50S ribosomal protein L31e [archaeon]|nr:50S ribosomal protein L31e [archaeon]